jgi:hypothetical protein
MKSSTLLLLLMMAPSFGGESVVSSHVAAAASAPSDVVGARPVYENGIEHQFNALADKNHSNEKPLLVGGPINEVEAKQLKLIFLLMLSQAQSRTPVH